MKGEVERGREGKEGKGKEEERRKERRQAWKESHGIKRVRLP